MKTEPTEARKKLSEKCDNMFGRPIIRFDFAEEAIKIAFKEGQSNPKIKQLTWIESEDGKNLTGIAIYAGYYRIISTSETVYMRIATQGIATQGIRKKYDTVEEAKAAAQRDFEKRIKECLE